MSLPHLSDLVLVCYMPSPRDMEIARVLGWYRIPLRTAPKVIAVDYLAFYQPASFGERRWQIESIAPVLGHELVTRAELFRDQADHPKAHEEYYKIQLGPLQPLPKAIPARNWKRLTFLYTTGEYLLKAEKLKDLVVQSEQRRLLWQALRERADQSQSYGEEQIPDLDIDPSLMVALLGIKNLLNDYEA